MSSMPALGVGTGNYGADGGRERGARRRKLAAMAGSVYRAGAVAVNEIKESYNQTRSSEVDTLEASKITIPGSFPDVAIVTKGNEQMVLFPSYAKRHVKEAPRQFARPGGPPPPSAVDMSEQEYWRQEWARYEDEKAVMDVDVRGWIYNPHKGPMTRRNRVLIGLARQLSGIPAPGLQAAGNTAGDDSFSSIHQQHEEERERQSIAREAQEIERRGRAEEQAAQQGDYSERPRDEASEDEGDGRKYRASRSPTPPALPSRTNTATASTLTDAELAVANANLMARIGPFMTTPLVAVPITLFFYNDTTSQSRTVMTDDSGHFVIRAALDFVPTHVRVLANEDISCTEPIQVIEPRGVSLISDIDDTIKRSNIALGAKEIFRNTFVRELKDLTIDGVKDWYNTLHDMGVRIHYCSNSPWQLYPVLATYFKLASLPHGSLHLKRYTGMLQGIFEPVAERKKGTLEKIMHDFPERKFLLVGDSGEADLEVYTELAVANPGRIKGIFIRDVTTPERPGYFDAAYNTPETRNLSRATQNRLDQKSRSSSKDDPKRRPALPPRDTTASKSDEGLVMGDLIDLSDDPTPIHRTQSAMSSTESAPGQGAQTANPRSRKPPPKPAKPSALQSTQTIPKVSSKDASPDNRKPTPTPPPPRRLYTGSEPSSKTLPLHPLSQIHNSSERSFESSPNPSTRSSDTPPPPPPPRRRGTPSSMPGPTPHARQWTDSGPGTRLSSNNNSPGTSTPPSPNQGQGPLNKKVELWRRRLERAQDTLSQHGVPLYTWRRGEDVVAEAIGIVKEAERELRL
ncbi:actin patch protein 1 [Xylaria bambusicola]|uniref:actin patch protein 1 n=1 Tax=Xylaria bambusicola TaxID=326684 RepID=UPI002008DE8D|nr:actin patch protein 1 [Xylaria bambusicola]KAI0503116.1 actin patch protein 1 [Xylaria bambusicola]